MPRNSFSTLLVGALLGVAVPAGAYDLLQYYSLKTSTVAGVAPGGKIVVKTNDGEKVRGELVARTSEGIVIRDDDGRNHDLSWSNIRWARGRTKAVGVDQARGLFDGDDSDHEGDEAKEKK